MSGVVCSRIYNLLCILDELTGSFWLCSHVYIIHNLCSMYAIILTENSSTCLFKPEALGFVFMVSIFFSYQFVSRCIVSSQSLHQDHCMFEFEFFFLFQDLKEMEFFTEYGDANRYKILEVVGKGSYGVVCAAIDTHTGEKVAIKKINDIFEHISDAIRILREVKLP